MLLVMLTTTRHTNVHASQVTQFFRCALPAEYFVLELGPDDLGLLQHEEHFVDEEDDRTRGVQLQHLRNHHDSHQRLSSSCNGCEI